MIIEIGGGDCRVMSQPLSGYEPKRRP